ncbi:MAG: LytR/AlgR family response regulator transcription factor [Tenuifilaceae bacterium]
MYKLTVETVIEPQNNIPSYLTEKGNIVRLIVLTAAFALVFINIYAPFGVETWYNVSDWELLLYSSFVILTGVLVVVLSRILMYWISKKISLNYWQYIGWVLAEVFLMAIFYTLFQKLILNDPRFFPLILKGSIKNTALVILLPYSVLWLYFSWREKKNQLIKLSQGQPLIDNSKNMIPFNDEKGILRFSVKMENLLYLESADNYVNIYYLDKGKTSRYVLRNTIKRLEETLKGSEIIRCHRSYMVNFDKVKILRKDKEELLLELDVPIAIELPVSKTYIESVMATFTHFCMSEKKVIE